MYDNLTFVFAYDRNKPIEFERKITKGDYETFYVIVSNFLSDAHMDETDLKKILAVYPEFKNRLNEDNIYDITINGLFNSDMLIDGIISLEGENRYKINWST